MFDDFEFRMGFVAGIVFSLVVAFLIAAGHETGYRAAMRDTKQAATRP